MGAEDKTGRGKTGTVEKGIGKMGAAGKTGIV